MDMKKLIDEADFDNINELSKRWKREPHHEPAPDQSIKSSSHHTKGNLPEQETNSLPFPENTRS